MKLWEMFSQIASIGLIFISLTDAQNLAFNRPATHAATYAGNEAQCGARNSVDECDRSYSLTYTSDPNKSAWWQVELESDCYVHSVTIAAPLQYAVNGMRFLNSLLITVKDAEGSSRECATFNNLSRTLFFPLERLELNCAYRYITGNTVVISRNGGTEREGLAMAEVIVKGILLTGNQALEKPTRQIGTYMELFLTQNSSFAVDRDMDSCALATDNHGSQAPWWQVNLVYVFSVTALRMVIIDSGGADQYKDYVDITVDYMDSLSSERICATYPGGNMLFRLVNVTLTCTSPLEGRFVTLRRRVAGPWPRSLGLCDVQVFGDYFNARLPTRSAVKSTSPVQSTVQSQSTTLMSDNLHISPTGSSAAPPDELTTATISSSNPFCTVTGVRCYTEGGIKLEAGAYVGIAVAIAAVCISVICNIVFISYYLKNRNKRLTGQSDRTNNSSCSDPRFGVNSTRSNSDYVNNDRTALESNQIGIQV